ncbi:HD domain-containing phosphohydrolase [Sideroxydans lithotrophicus]|uniref:Metal dependent phosphohydrolase n=1 Tax=Sideroxydans lithotrophicus (strain ES-1) TaxID=580332 RepID=D5CUS3_SIDLE|nr:HD domain-containing phosphohydrolase [Sideroxydans lithotrophicus]ADE12460.1 metal dependent phosphohydrolase [Sideroxydans lithotrophicus ES-1]
MRNEQQILTVLYEITLAIGGEVSVKPLLTKTLQQLLYHTSFPAGLVFLDLPPATGAASVEARLEAVVGDFELVESVGRILTLPSALLRGGPELRKDPDLLGSLHGGGNSYSVFLRLPIDGNGVILLLGQNLPESELPFTRIFQPVMANLAKAILLCRQFDAYSAGLITERDAALESLRKANRVLTTLSSGNEVLVRAKDETMLLREMCRVVVKIGGYQVAWVGYAQQDEQKSVRPMAQYGVAADTFANLRHTWADDEFGRGPTGAAIRSGELQEVKDAYTDPRFAPWRAEAIACKCASILALPLMDSEGHAFGAITIDAAETNAFDEEEIRLLRELASDLAYGIINLRSAAQLRKGLEDAIQAIAATVEMRDPYTAGHQRRVAQLAVAIATRMGLAPERIHGIRLAGTVHDVGKIGVPAEILSKPGTLDGTEFNLIKRHPGVGYEILKDVDFPWPIAQMVRSHHERQDGSGYPDGLKGEEILLETRIIAVADVVEAMASYRPYRPGLGMQAALEEIVANRGVSYDALVVDACCQVIEAGFAFA